MNEAKPKNELLLRIVPPFAAVLFTVVFALLGNWQLNRAAEKVAVLAMFENDTAYTQITDSSEVAQYQRVEVRGHFLTQRQVLIDNIIRNAKVGYFVVTAMEFDSGQPLLVVNRGWIEKSGGQGVPPTVAELAVGSEWRTLRGRAGLLPRVGIRSGEPFVGGDKWPRVAVYPTLEDVAEQLGREVLPYALLLEAEEDDGFMRDWQPRHAGPMTHYGYAFQWFALSLTVVAISIWQLRKKGKRR